MTCMGIEVDARWKAVSLPSEKMMKIKQQCDAFVGKKMVTKQQLQLLLGKLLYVANTIIPAQAFLNQVLWYMRGQEAPFIKLGDKFESDLHCIWMLL